MSGVLEHLIFLLLEKKIDYDLRSVSKDEGFDEQILLKFLDTFIYIMKNERRVAYYIAEKGNKRRSISKVNLLNKIKEL